MDVTIGEICGAMGHLILNCLLWTTILMVVCLILKGILAQGKNRSISFVFVWVSGLFGYAAGVVIGVLMGVATESEAVVNMADTHPYWGHIGQVAYVVAPLVMLLGAGIGLRQAIKDK